MHPAGGEVRELEVQRESRDREVGSGPGDRGFRTQGRIRVPGTHTQCPGFWLVLLRELKQRPGTSDQRRGLGTPTTKDRMALQGWGNGSRYEVHKGPA